MINKNINWLKTLFYMSGLLIILIMIQISLGAAVRLTGSGLSCPDWPLCYGLWFPIKSKLLIIDNVDFEYYQIMLEWLHRLNAAVLILPITLIVSYITVVLIQIKKIKYIAYLVLLALFVQGLIGGFTVIDRNSPWSVALHLGFALILLFFVLRLFLNSIIDRAPTNLNINRKRVIFYFITLMCIFLTMLIGAIVSKTGSSLACDLWPLCSNDNMGLLQVNKFIHLIHRFLAIIGAILVLCSFFLLKEFNKLPFIQFLRFTSLFLLVIQIFMGAVVIYLEVNIIVAMIHQILAVLLFMMISAILWFSLAINFKRL